LELAIDGAYIELDDGRPAVAGPLDLVGAGAGIVGDAQHRRLLSADELCQLRRDHGQVAIWTGAVHQVATEPEAEEREGGDEVHRYSYHRCRVITILSFVGRPPPVLERQDASGSNVGDGRRTNYALWAPAVDAVVLEV
jgi:hypothetical protein